jgi:hypothetical protein
VDLASAGVIGFRRERYRRLRCPRRKTARSVAFDRDDMLEKGIPALRVGGYETPSDQRPHGRDGRDRVQPLRDVRRREGSLPRGDEPVCERPARTPEDQRSRIAAKEAGVRTPENAAALRTGEADPEGGPPASALATGSTGPAHMRKSMAPEWRATRAVIRRRVDADRWAGLLPPGTAPGALADLALAVTQGAPVLARDGADRDWLPAGARAATAGWPKPGRWRGPDRQPSVQSFIGRAARPVASRPHAREGIPD